MFSHIVHARYIRRIATTWSSGLKVLPL